MIYDTFCFLGSEPEFELLRIRAEELKDLDVTHVLVEADHTFTGQYKPLNFLKRSKEFEHYNIISESIVGQPHPDPWVNERNSRNKIKDILKWRAKSGDTVILSDVDEIVFKEAVETFEWSTLELAALAMDEFVYAFNLLKQRGQWFHPKIATWDYLKDRLPDTVRNEGYPAVIRQAGHHYSWLGGVDEITAKLNAFSHQELNTPQNQQNILSGVINRKIFWNDEPLEIVSIDGSYPEYIQQHRKELARFIL